jgi:predicted nuclease of predicted toxin-antitoxin system
MRLLVDMNLSPHWIETLKNEGFDAVHWPSVGRIDASDHEIMAFASKHEYVVLTHDLDFGAILAASHGEKPSVVQIRSDDVSPDTIGSKIIAALRQMTKELDHGALLTVDPKRSRIRMLPLET